MAAVIDKRGLSIPLPGNLAVERARVIREVKTSSLGTMERIFPQRVTAPGTHPQRWWRVDYSDGTHQWFMVDDRVVTAGVGPGI